MRSSVLSERRVNRRSTVPDTKACMDGRADTCLFNPEDVFVESTTYRMVDLKTVGTDGKRNNVPIGTCIVTVGIEDKPVLLVFNESLIGKEGDTNIISANQVRRYGHCVDDLARAFGGGQCIRLASSQAEIPLELKRALIYLPFKKPTEEQIRDCERIYLTSDGQWDPDALHDGIRDNQIILDGLERIDLGQNDIVEDQDDEEPDCIGVRTRSRTTANVSNVETEERVVYPSLKKYAIFPTNLPCISVRKWIRASSTCWNWNHTWRTPWRYWIRGRLHYRAPPMQHRRRN